MKFKIYVIISLYFQIKISKIHLKINISINESYSDTNLSKQKSHLKNLEK